MSGPHRESVLNVLDTEELKFTFHTFDACLEEICDTVGNTARSWVKSEKSTGGKDLIGKIKSEVETQRPLMNAIQTSVVENKKFNKWVSKMKIPQLQDICYALQLVTKFVQCTCIPLTAKSEKEKGDEKDDEKENANTYEKNVEVGLSRHVNYSAAADGTHTFEVDEELIVFSDKWWDNRGFGDKFKILKGKLEENDFAEKEWPLFFIRSPSMQ